MCLCCFFAFYHIDRDGQDRADQSAGAANNELVVNITGITAYQLGEESDDIDRNEHADIHKAGVDGHCLGIQIRGHDLSQVRDDVGVCGTHGEIY